MFQFSATKKHHFRRPVGVAATAISFPGPHSTWHIGEELAFEGDAVRCEPSDFETNDAFGRGIFDDFQCHGDMKWVRFQDPTS